MKCTGCGNISRFEIYRVELRRLVLDFHLKHFKPERRDVVEHARVLQTGPTVAVRCIKCGRSGLEHDFEMTEWDRDFTWLESLEGHNVPGAVMIMPTWLKVMVKIRDLLL